MKSAITTVLVTGATVAGVAGVLVLSPTRSALTAGSGTSQLPGTGTAQSGSGSSAQQPGQPAVPGQGRGRHGSEEGESDDVGESGGSTGTGSTGSASTGSGSTSSGSTGSGSTSSGSSGSSATGTGYTGSAYQSPYGPMQVSITVSGTTITGIQWTQLPLSDGHSYRINSYAAPLLVEQAMAAQSATVDGVSGATYTTEGFRTSLESAIKKAGL